MAQERTWSAVSPQAFTSNGTQFGVITVADTIGFKTKQSAYLTSDTKPKLAVQVKRVLSKTQLVVGTINNAQIGSWPPLDISAYTVADSAAIGAEQQEKNKIQRDDIEIATYESDPTVAKRTILVDNYGNFYNVGNPIPVQLSDGSINIGTVNAELEVFLSAKDNDPDIGDIHDSVRIGDGTNELVVNPDGSINTVPSAGGPNTDVNVHDGSGNAITSTGDALDINIKSSDVDIATETTLSTLNAKLNSLGQKLMTGSVPVAISSDQSAIPVTQSGIWTTGRTWTLTSITDSISAIQSGIWNINDISGTISLPTNAATETTLSALNIKIPSGLTVSATRLLVDGSGVTQPVSGNLGRTWTLLNTTDSVNIGNFPATQAVTQSTSPWVVSGTVTANAGTGTFQVNVTNSSIPVTQSGIWNINDISGIISLPTGASTEATLSAINTKITTTANGIKVDGSAVTQPISGTVIANQGGSWTITANAGTNLNTSLLALASTQTDRTQKTQITDGTRDGTIKASSTAAIATDTSLVIALSPNSPIPSGTNIIGALVANQSINEAQVGGNTIAVGAGITTSGVQRVVLPTDQSAIPVTQSGIWTVQPGNTANTTPWLVTDSSNGPVTPGVVASKSSLSGGQFNTILPTVTNGQQVALQVDSSGRLIIAPSTSASIITVSNLPTTVDTNFGTVGASTIRIASQIGNATGAASFGAGTTTAQVLRVVLPTDQSAIPVVGTGSAGTPASNVITVQGISGGTSVQVAATPGTLTNRSGTTSGTTNTSTQLMPANSTRKYLFIQNVDGNKTIWINFTNAATTTQPSIQLIAGSSFVMESSFVSTEAINVISSSTSVNYTAKEA
ncbi:hypothetical protein CCP1ISM_130010 [Azospirillaceae bacterium]